MKKIFLISIITAMIFPAFGQTYMDALRTSQKFYNGTARFQSMGGAFGSLGGDFSAITINPAGLGVYRSSELSFSPNLYFNNSATTYNETENEEFKNNFSLNNLGFVFNFPVQNADWRAVNLGVGFNRTNTFEQNIFFNTNNAQGSLLDEFAYNANSEMGNYFYEGMALATDAIYFVDPVTKEAFLDATDEEINSLPVYNDVDYMSDFGYYQMLNELAEPVFGHYIEERHQRTGKSSEFDISLGSNYLDKLYLGGAIGITRFRRESTIDHVENTSGSAFEGTLVEGDVYVEDFNFTENYLTYGTGVNFKFGVIGRPIDFLRISAAIHTPTIQRIETEFSTASNVLQNNAIRKNEISDLGVNEFTVYTPLKLQAGVAFQYEKYAILSVDYEYMDYSSMKLRSDNENFSDINNEIENTFKAVNNIRTGLEIRFGSLFFRGGYAYYDNPFKSNDIDDITAQQFSGGFGVLVNRMKLDFGYINLQQEENLLAYDISPVANVNSTTHKFVATVAFRF